MTKISFYNFWHLYSTQSIRLN